MSKTIKLGDIAKVISGYAFKSSAFANSGVPVVKIANIRVGDVDIKDCQFVSEDYILAIDGKYHVLSGDILISLTGSQITQPSSVVGRVARQSKNAPLCLLNQRAGKVIIKRKELCDHTFIYYALFRPETRKVLASMGHGAASQANVSPSQVESLEIPFPPLPKQRRIAAILSAYDDLIENNTRRIQLLEEMARRIYEEWFVRFRFPGHENVPLVASELGPVPQGWLEPFSTHIDFLEGPGLRNWQYRNEGIPFLNIRTLIPNDIDKSKLQFLDVGEVESKYRHFLLKAYDHVVSSSGTLGRIVTIQERHLPLMLNTSIIRMRPKSERMGCWLLKHFLVAAYFQNQINAFASGSAQKNYGPMHLKQMWIISPTKEIKEQFEQLITPLEEQILNLSKRNNNLRTTRDLLLPKLISGAIDVADLDIGADE